MVRIAHVANFYGPKSGGLRTAMNALAFEYSLAGHEVLAIVPGRKDFYTRCEFGVLVEIASPIIPGTGGYRVILNRKKVRTALEDFKPDFLEISDRTTLIGLASWARKRGIRSSFFAHERADGILRAFVPWMPFRRQIVDRQSRKIASRVDKVIATTQYAAQEFQRVLAPDSDAKQAKLAVSPLGVNLTTFSPELYNDSLRDSFDDSEFLVLACTRLSKEKDPFFLIELAREAKRRRVPCTFLIVGTGPLDRKMHAMVVSENLPVHMLGYISDKKRLASLLATVDLFFAVGPIETFGLAALEALASGTPVICRDTSAIAEIISPLCGSALQRNAKKWIDELQDHIDDQSGDASSYARSRAEEFSWEASAAKILVNYGIGARV